MDRGKVQLGLIENGSLWKSVYRKRLAGLKKKAYEIFKLCDVPSLVISVDLDDKVETFPENKDEVCAILNKYNSVSNNVGEKYKQNSESVIQTQILKKELELNQLRMENENMVSATVKFLDSLLLEVQGRILLQPCMQDFTFDEEVENGVDVGKLNGEKECEEVEMAIEESAHCNGHGDLPNSSGGDMNDPQIVKHLVVEEPYQSNVFSGSCSEFSEHVPNSTCYADDGHPYLFELSDFIQF